MGRGGRKNAFATASEHEDRFHEGIDYLNEEFPFFTTHVLNIGSPRWDSSVPTAAVALDKDRGGFEFLFGPDFAVTLSPEEMGFVSAHETMHILLNHLQLSKRFDNHQKFNLAADAVINDYLASQGLQLPDGVVTGEGLVGEDCADLSVSEVYDKIEDSDGEGPDGEGPDGEGPDGGEWRVIDGHEWMHNASPEEIEAAEKAFQDAQENLPEEISDMKNDHPQGGVGKGQSGLHQWREESGVSLAWEDLLMEINPDILADRSKAPPEYTSFHRRPRRLAGFEDTILPVNRRVEDDKKGLGKPTLVMALDTSGSIGQRQAQQFITLAKSIPLDRVNLFTCTFTSQYMPLDLENPQWAGGGTDFSAIEQYIQAEVIGQVPQGGKKPLEEYPEAILVVTDGEAGFYQGDAPPQEALENNWYWIFTPRHTRAYLEGSVYKNNEAIRGFELENFVR